MKLFLWLCLIICFKDVFLQTICYKCRTNSLTTKEYFRSYNCSFLHDRKFYKCCVPITASFSCKHRRKRFSDQNFSYSMQTYSSPSYNHHFSPDPVVNSFGVVRVGQIGSFPPNQFENIQFQQSLINGPANNFFNPNNMHNSFENRHHFSSFSQQRTLHFQQGQPFIQQPDRNNFYPQPEPFAHHINPQFQIDQPNHPSNSYFERRENHFNINSFGQPDASVQQTSPHFRQYQAQPTNSFFEQRENHNLNNFGRPDVSVQNTRPQFELYQPITRPESFFNQHNNNFNPNNFEDDDGFPNYLSSTSESPNTKTKEETSSSHDQMITVRPPEKVTPIKRSLNKSEELPLTEIPKHKNFALLPLHDTCGLHLITNRIFGGDDALVREFPWMTLLEYSSNGRNIGIKCAGILINDRYVLTAAHCIAGRLIASQESVSSVRLGEHDINSEIDCDEDSNCNNRALNVEVEEIIVHHGYHKMNRNLHNDIALVRLSNKVLYTDFVKPVCLPLQGERTNPGENMTIVGWGFRNEAIPSHVKQIAKISYTNDTKCKELWEEIKDNQFCAGDNSRTNVCQGDSGGPIMSTLPKKGNWYVEGIVSFGRVPCGRESYPSVYTRVSSYITWILDNIRN